MKYTITPQGMELLQRSSEVGELITVAADIAEDGVVDSAELEREAGFTPEAAKETITLLVSIGAIKPLGTTPISHDERQTESQAFVSDEALTKHILGSETNLSGGMKNIL